MTDQQLFQRLPIEAAKRGIIPEIKTGKKSSYWLHGVINFILNIVYPKERKDVYLQYWTTFWRRICWSDSNGDRPSNWRTLVHELMHIRQEDKWGRPLFTFLYLWPLSQGILLLLLCWLPLLWVDGWLLLPWIGGWVVLAGLHFIPQLPDPWRKHWELQAYSVGIYYRAKDYGRVDDAYLLDRAKNFYSMTYYIMEPSKKKIERQLSEIAEEVLAGAHPVKDDPLVKLVEELRQG